jgi:hypothetical protein
LARFVYSKDGTALVFDATLTAKAVIFRAQSELLPKSRLLNTPQKPKGTHKA